MLRVSARAPCATFTGVPSLQQMQSGWWAVLPSDWCCCVTVQLCVTVLLMLRAPLQYDMHATSATTIRYC